ncbi:Rrf2 family transcriptional regulator [Paenibacillus sp. MER 99-2]|uniref:Rrf2 family transcriptional regulator n=1 Tax=Paenibacillus sp. MER 99-2 TaxID=2939572 RepID=UPI00203CCC25|nr:Rrf2 family transcriptional regulator [Paenibacillus sp. MER 99-2]MCM3174545.1 Rrf2 family transcriptional regulator [Paenibacillus sp. MER 99-2]
MSVSSRFYIGIHILSLLEVNKEGNNSSEMIADSVNTHPVIVRKVMGMLKKSGLVHVTRGKAGATLARDLSEITLFDVYTAVNAVNDNNLFNIQEKPNPDCPVGKNLQGTIEPIFSLAQRALEKVLENVTLQDIVVDLDKDSD